LAEGGGKKKKNNSFSFLLPLLYLRDVLGGEKGGERLDIISLRDQLDEGECVTKTLTVFERGFPCGREKGKGPLLLLSWGGERPPRNLSVPERAGVWGGGRGGEGGGSRPPAIEYPTKRSTMWGEKAYSDFLRISHTQKRKGRKTKLINLD